MTHTITIKQLDAQRVLSVREVVATPDLIGIILQQAAAKLGASGIQPVGPPMTIFHDESYQAENKDVEIAIPVDESVEGTIIVDESRQLIVRELPSMPAVACILHQGSFETLPASYNELGKWIPSNGYQICGPSREIYLTPPDSQGRSIVEIQFPVEKL